MLLYLGVDMGLNKASGNCRPFHSNCFKTYLGHRLFGEAEERPGAFPQKKEICRCYKILLLLIAYCS